MRLASATGRDSIRFAAAAIGGSTALTAMPAAQKVRREHLMARNYGQEHLSVLRAKSQDAKSS
jgi:hypothetical protein